MEGWRMCFNRVSERETAGKEERSHPEVFQQSLSKIHPSTFTQIDQYMYGWGVHSTCKVETARGLLNMKVKCERHFSTPHCSMRHRVSHLPCFSTLSLLLMSLFFFKSSLIFCLKHNTASYETHWSFRERTNKTSSKILAGFKGRRSRFARLNI